MPSNDASELVPKTMTAVRMYGHGGPEVLKVEQHPVPVPTGGEVLIRVKAVSVTWWDKAYRNGLIKPIPGRDSLPMPQQLGREASGDIVALGSGVRQFNIGDKVVIATAPACGQCSFCLRGFDNLCIRTDLPAHTVFGAYAEYIVRPASAVLKAPENVSYEKLACVLWSYSTIFYMMNDRACLRPGESVLVTGASGGMGTAALQLAKLSGGTPIIALSSNASKKDALLAAGADVVLNYKDQDIETQIRRNTADGMGVDVVIDSVGGPMAKLGINVARMGGRVVLAATMAGTNIDLDIMQLFVKNLSILGSRASTRRAQEIILHFAGQGKIDPIISHKFRLAEAAEANQVLEEGGHTGKIVLIP